jgi:mRNA interferase HigB
MRIIARKALRDFAESLRGSKDHKAVKTALDSWFHEVQDADWHTPADVVKGYANASIVGRDRVVFNQGKLVPVDCGYRLQAAGGFH